MEAQATKLYTKKVNGKLVDRGVAFPICISVNDVVCNHSPLPTEETVRNGSMFFVSFHWCLDVNVVVVLVTVIGVYACIRTCGHGLGGLQGQGLESLGLANGWVDGGWDAEGHERRMICIPLSVATETPVPLDMTITNMIPSLPPPQPPDESAHAAHASIMHILHNFYAHFNIGTVSCSRPYTK